MWIGGVLWSSRGSEYMVLAAGGRALCKRIMDDANLLFACKWESIVGEFVVLRSSHLLPALVCELGGAPRKYGVAFCFLGRRGLRAGFRLKVLSGKGGRKPAGSRSWWGDVPKVKLRSRASKHERRLG